MQVEVLIPSSGVPKSASILLTGIANQIRKDGDRAVMSSRYIGKSDLLMLYGVGEKSRAEAREAQRGSGRPTVIWDLGYFGVGGTSRTGWLRCSIDHDHPQDVLDETPYNPARWEGYRIPLREDFQEDGYVVLVGLGRKSRAYLDEYDWEEGMLQKIRLAFPEKEIVYRPKPGNPVIPLGVRVMAKESIEEVLRGASCVVSRHSNVSVDAAIAGVPFRCQDGAAVWLSRRPFTVQSRGEFLARLAYWNWHANESKHAWRFLRERVQ